MRHKKCKVCKKIIENPKPFQQVCGYECTIELIKLKKKQKNSRERKKLLPELYPTKYKKLLQDEICKLSRMIDNTLGYDTCIDCGETLIDIGQVSAAHYYNKKNHGNIRYNLHNLHASRSNCNLYSDTHKEGYTLGLEKRYSRAYLDRVKGLDVKYSYVKLSNEDVAEKLKLVRKLVRTFDTFLISDGISARDYFNKLIGIYL